MGHKNYKKAKKDFEKEKNNALTSIFSQGNMNIKRTKRNEEIAVFFLRFTEYFSLDDEKIKKSTRKEIASILSHEGFDFEGVKRVVEDVIKPDYFRFNMGYSYNISFIRKFYALAQELSIKFLQFTLELENNLELGLLSMVNNLEKEDLINLISGDLFSTESQMKFAKYFQFQKSKELDFFKKIFNKELNNKKNKENYKKFNEEYNEDLGYLIITNFIKSLSFKQKINLFEIINIGDSSYSKKINYLAGGEETMSNLRSIYSVWMSIAKIVNDKDEYERLKTNFKTTSNNRKPAKRVMFVFEEQKRFLNKSKAENKSSLMKDEVFEKIILDKLIKEYNNIKNIRNSMAHNDFIFDQTVKDIIDDNLRNCILIDYSSLVNEVLNENLKFITYGKVGTDLKKYLINFIEFQEL